MTRESKRQPSRGTIPGDGVLLIDKSAGQTSHDVVARVRRIAGTRKVGHAGTLDPMATGLLVIGINRATRLLTYVVGLDKTYEATIRLGESTVTDDAEGDSLERRGASLDVVARLESALEGLRGHISQVPSAVSAVKIDGVRSYARVRAGEAVELAARQVEISRFKVGEIAAAHTTDGVPVVDLSVIVECSSGTYIRALARDLGAELGVGGHLTHLRRTRVGPFAVEDAPTVESLETAPVGSAGPVELTTMTQIATALMPSRAMSEQETAAVRVGQFIPALDGSPDQGVMCALAPDGHVVALVERRGDRCKPVLVVDPLHG